MDDVIRIGSIPNEEAPLYARNDPPVGLYDLEVLEDEVWRTFYNEDGTRNMYFTVRFRIKEVLEGDARPGYIFTARLPYRPRFRDHPTQSWRYTQDVSTIRRYVAAIVGSDDVTLEEAEPTSYVDDPYDGGVVERGHVGCVVRARITRRTFTAHDDATGEPREGVTYRYYFSKPE